MSIFEYVDIDYKDSRLGVRFEPKNEEVAAQMVMQIPSDLRFYHAGKRRWILDPTTGPIVVQIIENFLPNVPVQIEGQNRELILSLLFGPLALPDRSPLEGDPVQLRLGGPTIFQWQAVKQRESEHLGTPARNRNTRAQASNRTNRPKGSA